MPDPTIAMLEVSAPVRVLQLEDNADDAALEQGMLRRAGIVAEYRCVGTREAFLFALDDFKPQIVLADHQLRSFDGKSAITLVQQRHPEIPVIVVSGSLGDEHAVELIKAGARDFIIKDRLGRLGAVVRNALAESHARALLGDAERALRESEQRFRDLIENSADVIGIVRVDGSLSYLSSSLRDIGGFTPEQLIGHSFLERVCEEDRPKARRWVAELIDQPDLPLRLEVRVRRADGTLGDYDIIGRNRIQVAGIQGIVFNMRDVTAHRKADADLRLAKLLIEQSPSVLFRWAATESWPVVYVSHNISQWGYTAAELTSGELAYAQLIHPDDLQRVGDEVAAIAASDVTQFTQEYRLVKRSGEVIWVDDRTSIERDATGRPAYFQGIVIDVTERKRREQEQQEYLQRLEQRLAAIAAIAASGALGTGDVEALAVQVSEAAALGTGAERANVWLFNEDETELRCIDLFEATPQRHSAGLRLTENEYRNEFQALKSVRYVAADQPLSDPRTAGYVETYLKPLDISSMLDVVIESSGRNLGLLCIEHVGREHHWEAHEISFASHLADKLGLCIANRENHKVTQELREAQRVAHLGNWRLHLPSREMRWSDEIYRILGLEPNVAPPTYSLRKSLVTPRSFAQFDAAVAGCRQSGQPFVLEMELVLPSGEHRWIEMRGEAVRDGGVAIDMLRGTAQDISAYKRQEQALLRSSRALKALSRGNMALVHVHTENDLYREMCHAIVDSGGYRLAYAILGVPGGDGTLQIMGTAGDAHSCLQTSERWSGGGDLCTAPADACIRSGKMLIHRKREPNPGAEPWLAASFMAMVALPLLNDAGCAYGALCIYSDDPEAFNDEELALLGEMADDLSYGVLNLRTAAERHAAEQRLLANLESAIGAIGATMEARDPYTAGHQRHVAILAAAIATEMGLPAETIKGIHFGGLIHDIGKIQVPSEILSKPGRLSKVEYELIKVHPQAGYDIIKGIEFPWPVAQMVLQHHERIDGQGYPRGLMGEQILPEARILAVADVLEAMSSHRPYRPALGVEAALAELQRGRGTAYDPIVVDACERLFRERGFTMPA